MHRAVFPGGRRSVLTRLILRLVMYPIGIGGFVGAVLLRDATPSWPAGIRLIAVAAVGSLCALSVHYSVPPDRQISQRSPFRLRRFGEPLPHNWPEPPSPQMVPSTGFHPAEAQFALDPRNSLLALGISAALLAGAIPTGLNGLKSDEIDANWILGAYVAGPAAYILVRSMLRLVRGSHAVAIDEHGVTLGSALGFIPPVRLERLAISEVIAHRASPRLWATHTLMAFVVDGERSYPIAKEHLRDAGGLLDWTAASWPEKPLTALQARVAGPAQET